MGFLAGILAQLPIDNHRKTLCIPILRKSTINGC